VVLEIVWVTTLPLAFTHWFAVSLAARLVGVLLASASQHSCSDR